MLFGRTASIVSLLNFPFKSSASTAAWTPSRGAGTLSATTATGVNYFKKGEDPLLKDDSEYPDWLWKIHEPPATLYGLQKKAAGQTNLESGELSATEVKRLIKLETNRTIKDRNFVKAKQ